MSYLVLARKYRPMFFEDVVGQQHVTVTLQNAIQNNRIASAYLFSGPRGVGKTTVARLMAKALNCDRGPTVAPCNSCSFCLEINESRSLDVFEIDGASNRGIDEVRNLRESLRYTPNPGKHRIYIIDEVHMLTNEAFNALLKTLEEPPARVLFIFATTEAHKVPATILSRCQRFDFKRMTNKNIIEQLGVLCQKEKIRIDDESLRLIASKADGSMRDSESLLDQIIAFAGQTVSAKDVQVLLGIIDIDLFFRVTDMIKSADVKSGLDLADEIFVEGYDFSEFLVGLAEHFRNIMVAKTTGFSAELNVSEEQARRYITESEFFTIEDLLQLIKLASDTDYIIRRSTNARLHLEVALVKMIRGNESGISVNGDESSKKKIAPPSPMTPSVQPGTRNKTESSSTTPPVQSRPGNKAESSPVTPPVQSRNGSKAESSSVTPPPQPAKGKAIDSSPEDMRLDLESIEDKWPEILEHIKKKKIALGSFLSEGWPTGIEGDILEITFGLNNGFHINMIEKNILSVQKLMSEIIGANLRIRCQKDADNVLERVRKIPAHLDKKTQFDKLVQDNQTVRNIIDTFNGEYFK